MLNMFRAVHRSSSGALPVFAASGLHTHVVTGRSQVWVGTDYGRSPHAYVNQRLQIQLELLMMSGVPLETCWAFIERWNNKFYYKVASCWLFLLSHTTMHGSMNIKINCLSFAEFFTLHLYICWGRSVGLRRSRQQGSWEVYITRSAMMSPNMNRVIKSRTLRFEGHVARMEWGERRMQDFGEETRRIEGTCET
jgi:hypothetical protein